MPRRPKADGDAPPKTRVRKKKESSICGTPGIEMKLEPVNPMGYEQMGGPLVGNIPQQGPPHNIMQNNGGINPANVFSPEELPQGSAAGPAGVGGMPPFSVAQNEYFYQHHGGPAGPMPPQLSMPPAHNMSLYGGPMMPPHPQQPHPAMPQISSQQFNEAEPQLPVPPFIYQQNSGSQPNALPGGPPMPNAQPGVLPAHLLIRQFPMTPLGPNFPQQPFLEHRIAEMNQRLYSFHTSRHTLSVNDHAQWWEAFSHEFFDDNAKMTISLLDSLEMTNRKYTIGRALIPRFHRTMFDSGVTELFYILRTPAQERVNPQQWGLCALDCENVIMVTKHDRPIPAEVHTECRLFLEFSLFEETLGYRIKHWAIELRHTTEYYSMHKDNSMENVPEMTKTKITRSGLPPAVLHYLKMCLILEPMQLLMHFSRTHNNMHPRDCLNQILFYQHMRIQQHQHPMPPHLNPGVPMNQPSMSVPQTPTQEDGGSSAGGKKPPRKRQRKNAAGTGTATASSPTKKKNTSAAAAAAVVATPSPTQSQLGVANMPPQQPQQQQQMPPPSGNFPPSHPGLFNPAYQEVMVVGEPSMMGCEYGEDDERAISRIENTQYIGPTSVTGSGMNGGGSGAPTSSLGHGIL